MRIWQNTFNKGLGLGLALILFACTAPNNQEEITVFAEEYSSRNTDNAWYEDQVTIVGKALGTSFVIKTGEDTLRISPKDLEVFFDAFNQELSTYIPTSLISQFNTEETSIDLNQTKYFKTCFEKSLAIYNVTKGAFDPTIFPLVNLWGFIHDINKVPSQDEVDSVLRFVGFEEGKLYTYEEGILTKKDRRFELVFNAIAKGQAVDEVAKLLDARRQGSYYIEIGGEIMTKGLNDRNSKWVIGIDEPLESNTGIEGSGQRDLENMIEISGKAMATSGNYRDFYELDGEVYSHTISPKTGKPIRRSILSATVIADDVATADAFATAFMVMGVDSALILLKEHPELNIDAYLLFNNGNNKVERAYSRGMLLYLMDK